MPNLVLFSGKEMALQNSYARVSQYNYGDDVTSVDYSAYGFHCVGQNVLQISWTERKALNTNLIGHLKLSLTLAPLLLNLTLIR